MGTHHCVLPVQHRRARIPRLRRVHACRHPSGPPVRPKKNLSMLDRALTVIRAMEEAIALHDPFNSPFEDAPAQLSDCDLPDDIEDPLELVRAVLGDAKAEWLQYEGDLKHMAYILQQCVTVCPQ